MALWKRCVLTDLRPGAEMEKKSLCASKKHMALSPPDSPNKIRVNLLFSLQFSTVVEAVNHFP